MIKFRFASKNISKNQIKSWLSPKCKTLPSPFSLKDISIGAFSDSIMKKMQKTTRDGAKIVLRKGKGYEINIIVLNKEDRKKQKLEVCFLKRRHTTLLKEKTVREFISLRKKLFNITRDIKWEWLQA